MREIDRLYIKRPFFGTRKVREHFGINNVRAQIYVETDSEQMHINRNTTRKPRRGRARPFGGGSQATAQCRHILNRAPDCPTNGVHLNKYHPRAGAAGRAHVPKGYAASQSENEASCQVAVWPHGDVSAHCRPAIACRAKPTLRQVLSQLDRKRRTFRWAEIPLSAGQRILVFAKARWIL